MPLPDTLILDVPNLLTAAGVFVALLAAAYSSRSAVASHRQAAAAETALAEAKAQSAAAKEAVAEARSQNRIAIHSQRLLSYKALLAFRSQLMAHGVTPGTRRKLHFALTRGRPKVSRRFGRLYFLRFFGAMKQTT